MRTNSSLEQLEDSLRRTRCLGELGRCTWTIVIATLAVVTIRLNGFNHSTLMISFLFYSVRNFDIPTAIDVLTTGSYQRLPSRIKQAYVEDDKPTRTEIAATLEKLDDVIRMRLLCDELVPPAMKYTVGKGKAKFIVANEFEVYVVYWMR